MDLLGFHSFAIRNLLKQAVPAAFLVALLFAAFKLKRIGGGLTFPASLPGRVPLIGSVILAAVFLPVAWRLALLPLLRVPEPMIQDEFIHLLTADTLVAGRLANPPHALWQHLDTIYVLQHPAYAGIYPIGQGAILAAGKILTGNAWFGILLATALMCGAITWVLFELLPLRWAAVGALPIAFTYGLQWVNSYWGGSFCAFGGAILLGAILKLRKSPSIAMAIVAGAGWSIVWLTRPFESILPFVLLWASVTILAIRAGSAWKRWIAPVLVLAFVQGCAGGFTLLHNRAVTGAFTTLPYTLSQKVNGVPQSFTWQRAISPPAFRFPELKEVYLWQLRQKELTLAARAIGRGRRQPGDRNPSATFQSFWKFFVTPWFSLPFLLVLFAIKDRMVAAAWILSVCALAASLLYPFFFPHYLAAYSCIFAFLIVRGLMVLDIWCFRGMQIGRWFALFVVLGGLLQQPVMMLPLNSLFERPAPLLVNSREYLIHHLTSMGGAHVVFVRYGPNHVFHDEWVNNAANIDADPVVWLRWMGESKDREAMRYYPDRQFWIVDVDATVATRVSRYLPQ